jgi:hypothetical protein
MPVRDPTEDFSQMWAWFATHCEATSPLYARISLAVAGDRELLAFVRAAPPAAHLPPALLAAVHYLVLGGADHPLAEVYAGRSSADPGALFLDFCRIHREEISAILAVRHIQTNECGRSAVIGPGLTWLASQLDGPYALVDVGASAGLNLLCDRFRLDYGVDGTTGPLDSPVVVECRVTGGVPPIAARLPSVVSRVGIDRSPIDLSDPDDARWLLACVWPDTGRLAHTAAAISMGQLDPPHVVAGDATTMLPEVLAELPVGVVAVVMTTWAFAYLTIEAREVFMRILDDASHHRPVAWLSAEGQGTVPSFVADDTVHDDHAMPDILGVVLFENGRRRAQLLALVQVHGAWIDWRAPGDQTVLR